MPSQSPTLGIAGGKKVIAATMDFPDALRKVNDGLRITKLEWNNEDTYLTMNNNILSIHKAGEPEKQFHSLLVSDGDMLGTDWVVLQ